MIFDNFDTSEIDKRQSIWHEFQRMHKRAVLDNVRSYFTQERNDLLLLDEVRRNVRLLSRSDAGIQTVMIENIVGSENRSKDFDRNWQPLKESHRERWMNIAMARTNDVGLPAVDLVKIGDAFFVRDGHHRISVASLYGQLEIEARLSEWHVDGATSPRDLDLLIPRPTLQDRLATSPLGDPVRSVGELWRSVLSLGQRIGAFAGGFGVGQRTGQPGTVKSIAAISYPEPVTVSRSRT